MTDGIFNKLATRIQSRKLDNVKICLNNNVQNGGSAGFEHVRLIHKALPEIDFDSIDTSCMLLGKKMAAPIIISGMTGGWPGGSLINRNLAGAAEKLGLAFGLGSQQSMAENTGLKSIYSVRNIAPSILLIGNLGLIQFSDGWGEKEIKTAKGIGIDALALHLNAVQEFCKPEGNRNWTGCAAALKRVCAKSRLPIIAKETGAGISAETARLLEDVGVAAIDISGLGGTNFALIESYRGSAIGKTFAEWGIPTVCSLLEVRHAVKLPLICSGGVRSGLDIAKAIALGADAVGIAKPLLKSALRGQDAVIERLKLLIHELKTAMALTGCKNISELKKTKYVLTGFVYDWAQQRLGQK
ncbi:MAG: type 2 isopentenyl-diphosphate Delta-isomerase [Candidatus Aenigmatarchaeota archaeon]|nr:type 2 isopentenyl-diphosphate Delta-isomerase [Candidatus Aenigmarchaeota archaeon]